MKTVLFLLGFVCASSPTLWAQVGGQISADTKEAREFSIVERGANHRVWCKVTVETNLIGRVQFRTNAITELETGMHFAENGEWKETKAEIELLADGAAATNGPHKVFFAGNVNTVGAIDLITPDGKRLRSRVFGLSYFDSASGRVVLLAETQDSIGQLIGANEVLYTNAFDDVLADVQYIYTKAGFEQNIILREAPPSPEEFELNPATTRLQVLTEFYDPPKPTKRPMAASRTNDLTDETLDFGGMKIGAGKAFTLGQEDRIRNSVRVAKQWARLDGRQFLVEEVPFLKVDQQMKALTRNKRQASAKPHRTGQGESLMAALKAMMPRRTAKVSSGAMKMAKATGSSKPGFVLDYQLMGSEADFTFKGDTTYYLTNGVYLTGVITIEGGAVVKFGTNSAASISFAGHNVICRTEAYRPAIFTCKDDNSVGETIAGSTGNPVGYYGGMLEWVVDASLHDVRILHLSMALYAAVGHSPPSAFSNLQIGKCGYGFYGDSISLNLNNILLFDIGKVFSGSFSINGTHLTIHQADNLFYLDESNFYDCSFANCLFVEVADALPLESVSYSHANVAILADDTGVFQTVGAGARYLADNSPYRNAGTTGIGADWLASLKKRTTYPPIVYSSQTIENDLVLGPQAQRDTDQPDLGYHYDALDYVFGAVWLRDASMTLLPGTAMGCYGPSSGSYGLGLMRDSTFVCEGTPDRLNRVVTYNTVQEQPFTNWSAKAYNIVGDYVGGGAAPQVTLRFTDWSRMARDNSHFQDYTEPLDLLLRDCQFHNGKFRLLCGEIVLTNSLFERVETILDDSSMGYPINAYVFNCLFYGGSLSVSHWEGGDWQFHDNLFDGVTIAQDGDVGNNYNAYRNATRLTLTGANDVLLTNFNYASGPLGHYYQNSTNLLNRGGQTSDLSGLYHFTVTTNLASSLQIKETNSIVDIGYHYVAVSTNGLPIDSDNDGVPDYLEDINGNGVVNSGETDWNSSHDLGLRVRILRPRNNSLLP